MMPDSPAFAQPAADIERAGYAIIHDFLAPAAIAALADECRALDAGGALLPAAVGRAAARAQRGEIRGDRTRWFEAEAASAAQTAYWSRIDALRVVLNRRLLLGVEAIEAHYARYAPGARYVRHRDVFRDDDARVLSSVLYLNAHWRDEDGGALRLYLPTTPAGAGVGSDPIAGTSVDIYPTAGTLVLFLSADFEHEVLPARRERLSVAGWLRRRAQLASG